MVSQTEFDVEGVGVRVRDEDQLLRAPGRCRSGRAQDGHAVDVVVGQHVAAEERMSRLERPLGIAGEQAVGRDRHRRILVEVEHVVGDVDGRASRAPEGAR